MPNDRGDQDLAVGRAHILVADHDHYRVFNKCGLALSFLDPAAPASMPNGTQHAGIESGVEGFYFDTVAYAQQTTPGFDHLADERVIIDPVTNRFVAMATKPSEHGIFLGVSEVHDARTWLQARIKAIPMEVQCGATDPQLGNLHRGSISTSENPDDSSDRLIWFIAEMQLPICFNCSCSGVSRWVVCKISLNEYLSNDPDPDVWWQEGTETYGGFAPTLARRLSQDGTPQYAVGVKHSTSTLELVALRHEETAGGALLAPHRHTIQLTLPPYNQPALNPLPSVFPTTGNDTFIKSSPMADVWKAVYRDGYVWAVHCDGTNSAGGPTNRSIVRWYKIAMNGWNGPGTSTPTIAEWGFLDPGPDFYCFVPSIAVHPNGMAAATYNATKNNGGPLPTDKQNISIYSHIKCNHLTAFNSAVLQYVHPVPINAPGGPLNPRGNGDYSGTVEDPLIPGRFWTHHGMGPKPTDGAPDPGSIVIRFDGCGADFTGDGLVNGSDVGAFGTLFSASALEADFMPDETIDGDDLLEYLQVGIP